MVEQEKFSWLLHLTSSFNLMAVNILSAFIYKNLIPLYLREQNKETCKYRG